MGEECIFCKIVNREIPCEKVYEDDSVVAFLDIFPAAPGHILIIPKSHFDTMINTPDPILSHLIAVAKKAACALMRGLGAQGVNLLQNNGEVAGQIIPHVHFHVVPRFSDDMIGSFKIKQKPYEGDQIKQIHQKITDNWDG